MVTEDDLVGGVIPCGVDDGGAPHRQAHRLAPHRQRGDTQAFETTVGTQPVDQLHRRGDVAGKEGRHEGLRIQGILHGLRCDLAHPTHWHLAGVAVGLGRGATEETPRHHRQVCQLGVTTRSAGVPGCSSAIMSGRFDVTPRHCTLRTGAGHLRQVDAEVCCQSSGRRLGKNVRGAVHARWVLTRSRLGQTLLRFRLGVVPRFRNRLLRMSVCTLLARPLSRHRSTPAATTSTPGLRCNVTNEKLRLVLRTVVNRHQGRSNGHRLTRLSAQFCHGSSKRAGKLDDQFSGLDLAQHIVNLDGVAGRHLPGDNFSLSKSFARVGHAVVLHVNASQNQKARERSTASRMRSTSGMCSPSALAGG